MQQVVFIFRRVLRVPTPHLTLRPPVLLTLSKKLISNPFQQLKPNAKICNNKVPQEKYEKDPMES